MNRLLLGLTVLMGVLVGPVWAEDVLVNAGNTPGTYYLRIDVKADGSTTVTPITKVVALTTPVPTPDPTPAPVVITERSKAIQAAAAKVTGDADRDGTAKGLAMLYAEISKAVKVGKVADTASLQQMVKMSTDMFLAGRGPQATAQWQPMRDVFSTQWAAVTAKGGSAGDYAELLDEAASGLAVSSPLKKIDPAMLALIFEILKIVLALFIK